MDNSRRFKDIPVGTTFAIAAIPNNGSVYIQGVQFVKCHVCQETNWYNAMLVPDQDIKFKWAVKEFMWILSDTIVELVQ